MQLSSSKIACYAPDALYEKLVVIPAGGERDLSSGGQLHQRGTKALGANAGLRWINCAWLQSETATAGREGLLPDVCRRQLLAKMSTYDVMHHRQSPPETLL